MSSPAKEPPERPEVDIFCLLIALSFRILEQMAEEERKKRGEMMELTYLNYGWNQITF